MKRNLNLNQYVVRAAYRLRATELRSAGEKLAAELQRFIKDLNVSKVDGTIQVITDPVSAIRALTRIGFKGKADAAGQFTRDDMDVTIRRRNPDSNPVIYITLH